jgi:IS1 family transposase/transposase-like protein
MVTITVHCPHCESDALVRNGRAPNSKQKYLCRACDRQSRDELTPHAYSDERREEILRAYEERSSLRGLERAFGVSRNTVVAWLKKKADRLPPLSETVMIPAATANPASTILELDELWSFVLKKTNQAWIWIALCRQTRQVVAYAIGDRSQTTCRRLWEAIPSAYQVGHCFTDFWMVYQAVIPEVQHSAVGKETGETAHVERWNNTLRQRLARFVRKTLPFSKSLMMHEACLRLFLHRYNLERACILQ